MVLFYFKTCESVVEEGMDVRHNETWILAAPEWFVSLSFCDHSKVYTNTHTRKHDTEGTNEMPL